MTKRKSFILHIDSLEILDDLTNEQAGLLFKAIKSHHLNSEIDLDPLTRIAFSPFKNQFIRDDEKYILTCERRADAGSKGGKAKASNSSKSKQSVANATNCKQDIANVADSVSKSVNDNKSDSKNRKIATTSKYFDDWWKLYPKKVERKKCLEIWRRRKLDYNFSILIDDITERMKSDRKWIDGYIPNPQTYLNGDRWEDEIQQRQIGAAHGNNTKSLSGNEQRAENDRVANEWLEKQRLDRESRGENGDALEGTSKLI